TVRAPHRTRPGRRRGTARADPRRLLPATGGLMSTFKVTAEKLTIHEHPNADALELAQVGLYRAVVVKGRYQTGDWAIYVPEQAVLPQELIDELGLANYLSGRDHNRVVPVKLRGQLSKG